MIRLGRRPLAIALAAGAGGFFLHWAAFGGLGHLWLGRLVTLPVAILLGPWYGVVAAATGALALAPTRPIFIAIFVAEALLVGGAAAAGRSPLLGGAILWAAMTATMALFPDLFNAAHLQGALWPLALQQLLNGMLGVVIAHLIAHLIAMRRTGTKRLQ